MATIFVLVGPKILRIDWVLSRCRVSSVRRLRVFQLTSPVAIPSVVDYRNSFESPPARPPASSKPAVRHLFTHLETRGIPRSTPSIHLVPFALHDTTCSDSPLLAARFSSPANPTGSDRNATNREPRTSDAARTRVARLSGVDLGLSASSRR
jgi:hypothetical protein